MFKSPTAPARRMNVTKTKGRKAQQQQQQQQHGEHGEGGQGRGGRGREGAAKAEAKAEAEVKAFLGREKSICLFFCCSFSSFTFLQSRMSFMKCPAPAANDTSMSFFYIIITPSKNQVDTRSKVRENRGQRLLSKDTMHAAAAAAMVVEVSEERGGERE